MLVFSPSIRIRSKTCFAFPVLTNHSMNFLETAVLPTICLRFRSSGLSVFAALVGAGGVPVEEAGAAGAASTEATCALMWDTDSLYCLRLSTYSRGVRIGDCCKKKVG